MKLDLQDHVLLKSLIYLKLIKYIFLKKSFVINFNYNVRLDKSDALD